MSTINTDDFFTNNLIPDFGWDAPFDSRSLETGKVECENPDFYDKFTHRIALMKSEHFGSDGDRDPQGIPGYSVKRICNGCGHEFGDRLFVCD